MWIKYAFLYAPKWQKINAGINKLVHNWKEKVKMRNSSLQLFWGLPGTASWTMVLLTALWYHDWNGVSGLEPGCLKWHQHTSNYIKLASHTEMVNTETVRQPFRAEDLKGLHIRYKQPLNMRDVPPGLLVKLCLQSSTSVSLNRLREAAADWTPAGELMAVTVSSSSCMLGLLWEENTS